MGLLIDKNQFIFCLEIIELKIFFWNIYFERLFAADF